MSNWFTGSGEVYTFDQIIEIIQEHAKSNGMVYVGTDSFKHKNQCIFSTAICLHDADGQAGGRYFIQRSKLKSSEFKQLITRITSEVQRSVEIGLELLHSCPKVKIELHLDVSSSEKDTKTSKFADMMIGYAKGSGFELALVYVANFNCETA